MPNTMILKPPLSDTFPFERQAEGCARSIRIPNPKPCKPCTLYKQEPRPLTLRVGESKELQAARMRESSQRLGRQVTQQARARGV